MQPCSPGHRGGVTGTRTQVSGDQGGNFSRVPCPVYVQPVPRVSEFICTATPSRVTDPFLPPAAAILSHPVHWQEPPRNEGDVLASILAFALVLLCIAKQEWRSFLLDLFRKNNLTYMPRC